MLWMALGVTRSFQHAHSWPLLLPSFIPCALEQWSRGFKGLETSARLGLGFSFTQAHATMLAGVQELQVDT